MRTLLRVTVLVVLLLAAAAAALRDSAYWSFIELHHGLQQRDVARVERVVDLERFAASTTRALGSVAGAGVAATGGLQGRLLGALVDAIAGGVGEAIKSGAAEELRRGIRDGDLPRGVGPFVVDEDFAALGALQTTATGASVTLRGSCRGAPASLVFELERHDDGVLGGHPRRWVIVGLDASSARALVEACVAAPGSKADAPS